MQDPIVKETIDVKIQYPQDEENGCCIVHDQSKLYAIEMLPQLADELFEMFKQEKREKFYMKIARPTEQLIFYPMDMYKEDLGW